MKADTARLLSALRGWRRNRARMGLCCDVLDRAIRHIDRGARTDDAADAFAELAQMIQQVQPPRVEEEPRHVRKARRAIRNQIDTLERRMQSLERRVDRRFAAGGITARSTDDDSRMISMLLREGSATRKGLHDLIERVKRLEEQRRGTLSDAPLATQERVRLRRRNNELSTMLKDVRAWIERNWPATSLFPRPDIYRRICDTITRPDGQ